MRRKSKEIEIESVVRGLDQGTQDRNTFLPFYDYRARYMRIELIFLIKFCQEIEIERK